MTRAPAPADPIHNPPHYQAVCHCPNCGHPIEAISITERFGFCLGNTLKYILRAGKKGDRLTDLDKSRWYLDRQIAAEKARRAAGTDSTAPQAAPTHIEPVQPTPGLYEAPTRLCRGYERTPA